MPNHYTTILMVDGKADAIAKLLELLRGPGDQVVDFDKVVPKPEILENTASGYRSFEVDGETVWMENWYSRCTKPDAPLMERYANMEERPFTPEELAELEKIGFYNSIDWARRHWGTKWNAYQIIVDNNGDNAHIEMCTAWSPPIPILEKLVEMFPTLQFEAYGRDEFETEEYLIFHNIPEEVT